MQTKWKLQAEFNSQLTVLKSNSTNISNNHEGFTRHIFRSWSEIINYQLTVVPWMLS